MMKLYFSPGACSLAPHIVLHEAGLSHKLIRVLPHATEFRLGLTEEGVDFRTINPLGYVPVLQLDDGTCLTEGPAIVQYIADQVVDRNLAPPPGTIDRARMQSWLNFISTELHKGMAPFFSKSTPTEYLAILAEKVKSRFTYVDAELAGKAFLLGDQFSVADPYLFTVTTWTEKLQIDITGLPNLMAFKERMGRRPSVVAALAMEQNASSG